MMGQRRGWGGVREEERNNGYIHITAAPGVPLRLASHHIINMQPFKF